MAGKVTVLNSSSEPITKMLVANNFAGHVPGWSVGPGQPPYTPGSLVVARSKYPGTMPTFVFGMNKLVFPWESRTGKATVNLPLQCSLDDDLILFLTQKEAILLTQRGVVINTSAVTTTLSAVAMFADCHPSS